MTQALVVLTTAPDESTAAGLAETLVREGLAACVHILPQGRSIYSWQGSLHNDPEWTLLIKTRAADYPGLESRLKSLHPYEVPEILALEASRGEARYLAWMTSTLNHPNTSEPESWK